MTENERFRQLRKARNYSQRDMAMEIGIPCILLKRIEAGKADAAPYIEKVKAVKKRPRRGYGADACVVRTRTVYWLEDGKLKEREDGVWDTI